MGAAELDFQDVDTVDSSEEAVETIGGVECNSDADDDGGQPSLEDLFALDDEPAPDVVVIGLPGPEVWFSVAVLTVPDLSRYPIPAEFGGVEEVRVDLGNLAALSGSDTKALLQPSLPAEQLEQIYQEELNRDKPRGIVLKAIAAEQDRRGGGFESWVVAHAANPLTSQIAALAYSCGDAEPVVFGIVDGATDDDPAAVSEREALRQLFRAWRSFCAETGYSFLSAWDLPQVMRVVTARSVFHGMLQDGHCYSPHQPVSAASPAWLAAAEQAGGLRRVGEAVGMISAEIVEVPSPLQVFLEFRQRPGSVLLQDWASGRLSLEREILSIGQSLWDR